MSGFKNAMVALQRGRSRGSHASMHPSDLPGSDCSLQRPKLRLESVPLFCSSRGAQWLLKDFTLLQSTVPPLAGFELPPHGLGLGIPKNEVPGGAGL